MFVPTKTNKLKCGIIKKSKKLNKIMKNKNFLKWFLIIGIAIILNLFFAYAIKVGYPGKDYNEFCPENQLIERIDNADECIEKGGQWDASVFDGETRGVCDQDFQCRKNWEEFRKVYEKNVFIILIILGVTSIVASFLVNINPVLSASFSFGGVLTFVVASLRYWELAPDWLHLTILGIALASLIWLGVKKFNDMK